MLKFPQLGYYTGSDCFHKEKIKLYYFFVGSLHSASDGTGTAIFSSLYYWLASKLGAMILEWYKVVRPVCLKIQYSNGFWMFLGFS